MISLSFPSKFVIYVVKTAAYSHNGADAKISICWLLPNGIYVIVVFFSLSVVFFLLYHPIKIQFSFGSAHKIKFVPKYVEW